MLVLSRKEKERVHIGGGIVLEVIEVRGDKVRLGFTAPSGVPIDREEVFQRKLRESSAAVDPQRN